MRRLRHRARALSTATVTTSDTLAALLTTIADETVDVIQFTAGTYHLAQILVDVDRTRHLTIRPVSGATVIFAPGAASGNQWAFGTSARTGNITMEGFIFDGYAINDTGVIGIGHSHDLVLNDMTVRNCTAVLSSSSSWAFYSSSAGGVANTNITADRWRVDGNGRAISAAQSYHDPNAVGLYLRDWTVVHCGYAFYANSNATGILVDGWTISDCGVTGGSGPESIIAVSSTGQADGSCGVISNMTGSNMGNIPPRTPSLTDGGGNVWS